MKKSLCFLALSSLLLGGCSFEGILDKAKDSITNIVKPSNKDDDVLEDNSSTSTDEQGAETNNSQDETNSNTEKKQEDFPSSEIEQFFKDFDLEITILPFSSENKDISYEIKSTSIGDKSMEVLVKGTTETELQQYCLLLLQNNWEISESNDNEIILNYKDTRLYLSISLVSQVDASFNYSIYKENTPKDEKVTFWSGFGSKYTSILNNIVSSISTSENIEINHQPNGSYYSTYVNMMNSIASGEYPSIAMGYPNHFVNYLSSDILEPLDSVIDETTLNDYDPGYLHENYLYNNSSQRHLYGVPFNKSTEVLAYNGSFVDYCAELYGDPTLRVIPATWTDWADKSEDSKVSKYNTAYFDMINNEKVIYAYKEEDGSTHGFSTTQEEGMVEVFNFANSSNKHKLISYESQENAFITLLKQFGSEFASLPESELSKPISQREGHVLFGNEKNLNNTLSMLQFFNKLHNDGIFGITYDFGLSNSYLAEPLKKGQTMFAIVSSGSLSTLTNVDETTSIRIAPIPYLNEDAKYVITQGGDICMTNNANKETSWKVLKALTTGEKQAEFAVNTGFFPVSKSAYNTSTYQAFLNDTSYESSEHVIMRNAAKMNSEEYMNQGKNWISFTDDAFISSDLIRMVFQDILWSTFEMVPASTEDLSLYKSILDMFFNSQVVKNISNIVIEQ